MEAQYHCIVKIVKSRREFPVTITADAFYTLVLTITDNKGNEDKITLFSEVPLQIED